MPDFSMCLDHKCPSRESCHRYTAIPDGYRQCFADFEREKGEEKCEYYWKVEVERLNDV